MNKSKTRKLRLPLLIFSLFFLAVLYGCGDGPGESSNSPGGTTPTPTGSGSLTLDISANTVTFGTPVTATATLRDANGALVQGAVVSFAATSGLVTFTPTSATALTNAGGIASVTLNAAGIDSDGATSITASAPVTTGGTTATVTSTPVGMAVNGGTITLGPVTLGQPSISAYGTSSVRVPVMIGGSPATVPISVVFTSPCVSQGKATLSNPVTTIAGTATSTYKDNNCNAGTDRITASVTGATAFRDITIVPPLTNSIQFVSATPSIIGTSTASSALLPTSSLVKFKVVDSNNIGKQGIDVDFTTVPPNPTSLFTLSALSATSDANGEVTTTLSSGTIPTPVWVVATVRKLLPTDPTIKSQSNTLTITTGLPTQDFFSLSIQTPNIEGWIYDGMPSALTIIASDRLGNPVPDGTVINFITEGAQITPASCKTTAGTCTTTFKSSESRPADGRLSILAYAIGEKSFVDANSNNSYDAEEPFYDIGDPYNDNNENGQWNAGEFVIPPDPTAGSPCTAHYPNAFSRQGTCTGVWGQNYVRRNAVLVLSGSTATITPTTVSMGSLCIKSFDLLLMDLNGNPMPAGTTISTANNAVYYIPNGETKATLATATITDGTPVLNNIYPTRISLRVNADCMAGAPVHYPAGAVDIVVTTPKGNKTTIPVTVN